MQELPPGIGTEEVVGVRYAAAARQREAALCCPVDYDRQLLEAIPAEVIERDYGCGDPSRFVRPGDRVLDLGSGGGKICFIAAQLAGEKGSVLGVDMNEEMLALARRSAPQVAERIGYANVEFRRGRIQDLGLDLDRLDAWLREHPVRTAADWAELREVEDSLRRSEPLVVDASVDLVVSNCVLNLVREADKAALIHEVHRVLRPGGRIALSDIVSDEPVPEHLKADPELWSGCVSGAFQEQELVRRLEQAGFAGVVLEDWQREPFAVVEGITFRSVTLSAVRPDPAPERTGEQSVIYRGPWREVRDESGGVLRRGERTTLSGQAWAALSSGPWAADLVEVPAKGAVPAPARSGCCG